MRVAKKLIRKKVVFTWKMQHANGSGVIKERAYETRAHRWFLRSKTLQL
nr:MAG TPA: hypothetical protein [Caudoviricetes sp.]DAH93125.1 MAG TPA: hypothetical protein [Caudoviricetes sp.]